MVGEVGDVVQMETRWNDALLPKEIFLFQIDGVRGGNDSSITCGRILYWLFALG